MEQDQRQSKKGENAEKLSRLFLFNPDCELAIANGGKYYIPPVNIVQMTEDLAFLPAFLGEEGDRVLVKAFPDEDFIKTVYEPLQLTCKPLTEKEIPENMEAVPWGWSPRMCHWLKQRKMGKEWKPEQKEWYSRKTAKEGLCKLLERMDFLDKDLVPRICTSLEEIEQNISGGKYLAKSPWSSSGKGLLALENQLAPKEKEWLGGILRRQGYFMLEKKLDKVQDFAMEFYSGGDGIQFIGWSAFTTGERGEYRGNYIGSQQKIIDSLAARVGSERLELLKNEMPLMLQKLLPFYRGYFGVDMMIYRNTAEAFCIQPCVEINLRCNMGIVALFLSSCYRTSAAEGKFSICFYPGKGEALEVHKRLQSEYPAVYKNNRICSGYLNLTPVNEATHFVASLHCY